MGSLSGDDGATGVRLTRSLLRRLQHQQQEQREVLSQTKQQQDEELEPMALVSPKGVGAKTSVSAGGELLEDSTMASPKGSRAAVDQRQLLEEYDKFQLGLGHVKRPRKTQTQTSKACCDSDAIMSVENQVTTCSSAAPSHEDSAPASANVNSKTATVGVEMVPSKVVLAEEEKAMDGAPEGELFLVNVLSREEFAACGDWSAEKHSLQSLLNQKQSGDTQTTWAQEYCALDSLRRISIHHQEQLDATLIERALSLLVYSATMSLRSTMARNALLCIQDLVMALRHQAAQYFDKMVPVVISRAASDKVFLRQTAEQVLDTMVECCASDTLLHAFLLTSQREKNAQAVSVAAHQVLRCLKRLPKADLDKLTALPASGAPLLELLSAFLNCRLVECKTTTKQSFRYIQSTIGSETFEKLVKTQLKASNQMEVLKCVQTNRKKLGDPVTKASASTSSRVSIRERMRLMQQRQAKAKTSVDSDTLKENTNPNAPLITSKLESTAQAKAKAKAKAKANASEGVGAVVSRSTATSS